MFNKEKAKGFICGVCIASIISATTVFATNIDVIMGGIKVYWDGIEKTLTDVKGNKVEPIIYNGTTYVPVRAMSNLMGKDVDWNQQEQAVYVGQKPVAKTTPIEKLKDEKKIQYGKVYTRALDKNYCSYEIKEEIVLTDNMIKDDFLCYLDGNYSKLVAKAVIPYTSVPATGTGTITFYSVENDGTENEIKTYELAQTKDVIDININLKGVENLKIVSDYTSGRRPVLFDISLLGR